MSTNSEANINTGLSSLQENLRCAISVDCVVIGYDQNDLKVLTIKCNIPPYENQLSLLGELVLPAETLDQAAKRILKQWTDLDDLYLEEVKVFSKLDRHPLGRVITVVYYSLMEIGEYELRDAENKGLEWINVGAAKNLAFDHNDILKICLKRLRLKLKAKPIGFNLLPKKFTLNQLQNLYETVLELKLDKRNFRRKLNSLGLLIDLGENQNDVSHRPAKLYSFDFEKYKSKKKDLNFEL